MIYDTGQGSMVSKESGKGMDMHECPVLFGVSVSFSERNGVLIAILVWIFFRFQWDFLRYFGHRISISNILFTRHLTIWFLAHSTNLLIVPRNITQRRAREKLPFEKRIQKKRPIMAAR